LLLTSLAISRFHQKQLCCSCGPGFIPSSAFADKNECDHVFWSKAPEFHLLSGLVGGVAHLDTKFNFWLELQREDPFETKKIWEAGVFLTFVVQILLLRE